MRELLSKHNPWWKGEGSYVLRQWENLKKRWIPKWLNEISITPYSLNFVIGPRQVGKTTGLHLLIDRLISRGIEPTRIFYFNLDLAMDLEIFRRILDEYLEFRRAEGHESSFIFLDEVTSLRDWWKVIKGYVDLGLFEKDVLTLTGSSSLTLRGEVELFPGRRGFGRDVLVSPLSFREFLEVHGIKVKLSGNLKEDLSRLLPISPEIKQMFKKYVKTGGFPLSVNEDPRSDEQYLKALEGEILRLGKNPQLVRAIVSSIMRKAPSPLSYSSIAADVGVSYKTVQEYLDILKKLMVIETALFKEGNRISWRKEKKYFPLDPFIARSLSLWTGASYLEGAFYEWMVQAHLFRKFGEVYYYRNSYEVDCIAGPMRVEVKVGKPHRRYPKDVLIVDEENLPAFLASLV